uniref:Mitochondrial protein n=1 Tax=Tanacetum cinerariifolium TaxID=118510 RepID=A0A6L2NRV5_TANCI|nr:hypothetical protein [Tanacetum cinerariifolium]
MSRKRVLTLEKDSESIDSIKYRGMIGSLLYLTASRPAIMFSVCLCDRFQEDPKVSHLEAVKRIFSYSQDTREGNALDPWIPVIKQGEQQSRGSTYNGINSFFYKDIKHPMKDQDPAFLI